MHDLRQGITPAAHAALDQLENIRDTKPSGLPPQPSHYYHANMAKGMIAQLLRTANDAMACHYAIEAAAHLLRFAEEGDEQLARMGRPSRFQKTPAGQAAGDAGSEAVATPPAAAPVAPAADRASSRPVRPTNCRNAQRERGEPYPRSGCQACGNGMMGCPYDRRPADRIGEEDQD